MITFSFTRVVRLAMILISMIAVTGTFAQTATPEKITQAFLMADEVSLQTDIYFRDTIAKYPVILLRSPYPRKQYSSIAHYFCSQGYIVVIQSVRGTGGSGGKMIPFVNETSDGLQVLDLLTEKSWCNGSIGIYGSSYGSFCGLTLGASKHPSLKALININGWLEPSLIAMPSGVNHIMMNLPWMLFNYSNGNLVPGKYHPDSLFQYVPVNNALEKYGVPLTLQQMHGAISTLNQNFPYKDFSVPVMHVTGMYDFTKEGTFNLYDSLRKYNKTQRIFIGPWIHDQLFSGDTKVGEWELPRSIADSSGKRILTAAANWFKWHLKNGSPTKPIGAYSAMPVFSESFNLNAYEFPGSEIKTVNFYLQSNAPKSGTLKRKPTTAESTLSLISNPNNPVPTTGGANFHFFKTNAGIRMQNEVEKRSDVLLYTTDKINGQFWGVGKAMVKLFVSHSSADCDFTAKLVAVDSDENAWNICDGITRMSLTQKRNTGYKDGEGNTIYEIQIDLGHIVFQLQPRWSLRLEIAGTNFPKYDRNPGNGDDPLMATKFYPVKQFIHHGKNFPAVLTVDELD